MNTSARSYLITGTLYLASSLPALGLLIAGWNTVRRTVLRAEPFTKNSQ